MACLPWPNPLGLPHPHHILALRPQGRMALSVQPAGLLGYDLMTLLDGFARVFPKPTACRCPDLQATLHYPGVGASTIAACPYHYPTSNKDDLDRQSSTMMEQDSSSKLLCLLIASLAGQDGGRHMAFLLRLFAAFNTTVKDVFPIPVLNGLSCGPSSIGAGLAPRMRLGVCHVRRWRMISLAGRQPCL